MKTYLLLYCCFQFYLCINTQRQNGTFELRARSGSGEPMSGVLQRIVKTYYCAAEHVREQQIILYGTKAWTFPVQDVNLTLRYPPAYLEDYEVITEDKYIITGLLLVLHIDGSRSRGYITDGGILMDHISMTFVIENISRLSYQFWLYGVNKSYVNVSEQFWQNHLC